MIQERQLHPHPMSAGCYALGGDFANSFIKGDVTMKQLLIGIVTILVSVLLTLQPTTAAEGVYTVKPVAQKKIKQLPDGPLYWRVENFPTVAEAKTAIGPDGWNPASVSYEISTSLIAEVAGKVWVLSLGAKGGSTPGGSKVAEIGPVPPITASEYLLRVNYGSGPAGAKTPVHSHPGSEAFYVVSGRLGQRTPHGVSHIEAGHTMNGHPADVPMQVFNSGTTDLHALIMFVVDASKPFSVPTKFE
jgi:quercetin dioxygenase-like cupin family protein